MLISLGDAGNFYSKIFSEFWLIKISFTSQAIRVQRDLHFQFSIKKLQISDKKKLSLCILQFKFNCNFVANFCMQFSNDLIFFGLGILIHCYLVGFWSQLGLLHNQVPFWFVMSLSGPRWWILLIKFLPINCLSCLGLFSYPDCINSIWTLA